MTAISVSAANEHDGHHAGALVDQQPERRRPKRVIGDTAYGNVAAREQLEQRSVAVLAPVHSSSPTDGPIPKEAFAIDLETDTVTCPQGNTTQIYKPKANRKPTARPSERGTAWRASRARTASPARSESAAPRAASATSASAAARTCAKPRCARYRTPPSASTSNA